MGDVSAVTGHRGVVDSVIFLSGRSGGLWRMSGKIVNFADYWGQCVPTEY